MAPSLLSAVLQYLHRLHGGAGPAETPGDAELLRRFAASRDEAAFAVLVGRHGPMVWGVCKRLLPRQQDAEDAFQAAFLVLVRKSRGLLRPDLLGPWLHAVALRTALRLRGDVARRRRREQPLVEEPVMDATPEVVWRDLRPVLDQEVDHLPPKYRAAFVLCCLEGLTNEEAARRLGCPKGTVQSRLARGRELLRRRLIRRGLGLSAGALAVALVAKECSAAVPAALAESTVRSGMAFAAGGAALSVHAAALAQGVLKSMFLTQIKLTVAALLALAVLAAGTGLLAFGPRPAQPSPAVVAVAPDKKPEAPHPSKPAADDPEKKPAAANLAVEDQALIWRDQLDKPIDLDGFDDQGLTLAEALELIEKRYGLRFEVNHIAFTQENLDDVLGTRIAERRPLPKMKNVTLGTALRIVLDRLPVPALAVIRKDTVEITTVASIRAELGVLEARPLLPLVWEAMNDVPLPRALQLLAKSSGMNVILDPRALSEDTANLKITAHFTNVPVDSAVRILANMADLQAVQLDNVLYVTTPKRAAKLQAEKGVPQDAMPPQTPRQSGKMPGGGAA